MTDYIEREALMRRIKEIHCAECDSYHGVRCRACWVDDTLDYIDSEPAADVAPVQKWISVKDRLPENEQDVVICAERRHYSNPNRFIRIVAKAFYTDGKHDTEHTAYAWNNDYIDMEYDDENDAYLIPEGWWESIEYGEEFSAVSDFVTHWMPSPEPPKEE